MKQDTVLLAKALESGIMMCLNNAMNDPEREEHWRRHADRLEAKFTNEFGNHYSYYLYGVS